MLEERVLPLQTRADGRGVLVGHRTYLIGAWLCFPSEPLTQVSHSEGAEPSCGRMTMVN